MKAALPAFLLSRGIILGASVVAPFLLPENTLYPDGRVHTTAPAMLDALTRWDGMHYLALAESDYDAAGGNPDPYLSAYWPLYPALMRIAGGWAGETGLVIAGVVISNLSFLLLLATMYRLVHCYTNVDAASKGVTYLALCPTSVFFSGVYAESLFVLLAALCLESVYRRSWVVGGFFGALAALTRAPGVLLAVPLLWEWWRTERSSLHPSFGPAAAVSLVVAGLGSFLLIQWYATGDPFAMLHAPGHVGIGSPSLLETVLTDTAAISSGGAARPGFLVTVALTVLLTAAGLQSTRYGWPSIYLGWVLAHTVFLVVLCLTGPYFASMHRYVLPAFPAFGVLGAWGRHGCFHVGYLVICTFLLMITTVLFTQWYWVG